MYGLRITRIAQRMISPRGRSARTEVRRTRPQIEALEARLVLSSSGNTLYPLFLTHIIRSQLIQCPWDSERLLLGDGGH